jgi:hypothetical protein
MVMKTLEAKSMPMGKKWAGVSPVMEERIDGLDRMRDYGTAATPSSYKMLKEHNLHARLI